MIITTTPDVPGRRIQKVLGLVRGNTIRARHLGRDISASIRNITGGEMRDYTKLMAESREQAIDRMCDEAEAMGAHAVVAVRFQTCEIARNAAEMLCYGTAVSFSEGDEE